MKRLGRMRKDAGGDAYGLLGPPRNAHLWQQAREMAAALRSSPSYSDILQFYQILCLAPGFQSVSAFGKAGCARKPRRAPEGAGEAPARKAAPSGRAKLQRLLHPGSRLRKDNVGKDGEGAWAYARREAEKRGKPKSYAVAIAQRLMGKSLSGFADGGALARMRGGLRLNADPRFAEHVDRMMPDRAPRKQPGALPSAEQVLDVLANYPLQDAVRERAGWAFLGALATAAEPKELRLLCENLGVALDELGPGQRQALALDMVRLRASVRGGAF